MKSLRKLVIGLVSLFILVSLLRNVVGFQKTLRFYDSIRGDYEKEKKKNVELRTQLLKTRDPYEIEKRMRNELNLGREGETVILLPAPTSTPSIPSPTPAPVYIQWFDVFFQN